MKKIEKILSLFEFNLFQILFLVMLVACQVPKEAEDALFKDDGISTSGSSGGSSSGPQLQGWRLDTPANYTYDTRYISVTAGRAILQTVDTTFSSAADYTTGSHYGTIWDGTKITLGLGGGCDGSLTNCSELNSSWTPRWANLQGYWKFNGDASDSTANGNTGSSVGSVAFSSTDPKIGSGYLETFTNGGADRVEIPDSDNLDISSNLTISAWVYYDDSVLTNINLISKGNSTSNQNFVSYRAGSTSALTFWANRGGVWGTISSSGTVLPDRWVHLGLTYNAGSGGQLYINGEPWGGRVGSGVLATNSLPICLGECFTGRNFGQRVDDFAIWDTELTPAEIKKIYDRQFWKYAGTYESAAIDMGSSAATWTDLNWTTEVPFGKELVGNSTNELIFSYQGLVDSSGASGNSDLANNLVALYHFNNNASDSSGSGNHATVTNAVYTTDSFLGSHALEFDGNSDFVAIPYGAGIDPTVQDLTISLWVYSTELSGNDIFFASATTGADRFYLGRVSSSSAHKMDFGMQGAGWSAGAPTLGPREWTHVLLTVSGTTASMYINGDYKTSKSYTSFNLASNFQIGRLVSSPTGFDYKGLIDEVAIWSRALHPNEIKELYRRGGNTFKLQVRSCNDSVCAGENWFGSNGSSDSHFGEEHNCASIDGNGNCSGLTQRTSPNLTFSDFVMAPPANQFFQYKALLESNEEEGLCAGSLPCLPSARSLEIGPTPRFYGGSPTVTNATPISFTSLTSFNGIFGGACTVTYQLSLDNVNYYYWNGSDWVGAVTSANSNTTADINSNIDTFAADVGTGNLYWRALLNSNLSQACTLNDLEINYE